MEPCKKCGGHNFYVTRRQCKDCSRVNRAVHYAANREKILAYAKAYTIANKAKITAYQAEYHVLNAEKRNAEKRAYRLEHIEEAKVYKAKWEKDNAAAIKVKRAAYRAANKAKISLGNKIYQAANCENIKIQKKKYAAANLERDRLYRNNYRLENYDKLKKARDARHEANPEKRKSYARQYKIANRVAIRIHHHNRRVKKTENGDRLTKGLADKLLLLQRSKCPCCGMPLGDDYHIDHITPLKLGGRNVDSNIQLLRAVCNMRKNAKDPILWMQEKGFLL